MLTYLKSPIPQSTHWLGSLAVFLTLLLICGLDLIWIGTPKFPYDDAYITLHNARLLISGVDLNYPGVSALCGSTSAVHVVLVALVSLLLPGTWSLYVVSWLALIAYGMGLLRLALQHQASPTQALLLLVLGLTVGEVPHHFFNGLETGLMLAALIWTFSLFSRPYKADWVKPAVCGFLPYIRPELTGLAGLLFLYLVWERWKTRMTLSNWRYLCAKDMGIACASAFPWFSLYFLSTGLPWAPTAAAKTAFFAEQCYYGPFKTQILLESLVHFAGIVGIAGCAVVWMPFSRIGQIGIVFGTVIGVAYYQRLPMAFAGYEHRYLYWSIPLIVYAIVSVWNTSQKPARLVVNGVLVLAVAFSLFHFNNRWKGHQDYTCLKNQDFEALTRWCNYHIPSGARILLHDAGYMSEYTNFHLIDLVGLKSPASVPINRALILNTCGKRRDEATHQIALQNRAEYMIVLWDWNGKYYKFTEGLQQHGWQVNLVYKIPTGVYEVYQLTPPQTPEAGFTIFEG